MSISGEKGIKSCNVFETSSAFQAIYLSGALFINQIVVFAVNIFLIIPTILLNAVSITTILKSSQLKSKPCYFIILLQSAADLAVGALGMPSFLVYLSRGIGGIPNCLIAVAACRLSITTIGVSLVTFFAMTLERYVAIIHPFAYASKVTNNMILVTVTVAVIVCILLTVLLFMILRFNTIAITVIVSLLFSFTVYAYTRIYLVVLKKTDSQNFVQDVNDKTNLRRRRFLQEIKQAKSCFLVVICYFILGFVPTTLLLILNHQQAVETWVLTLCMMNSSANSVIFFWTKTMLRREAVKMLKSLISHKD